MSFMVIAVAMLTAFILQFLFQMVQMRSFNKYYTRLRKMGRVAIGKAKGGFHAGAIVMFAIDQDGVILKGCFMRGFTRNAVIFFFKLSSLTIPSFLSDILKKFLSFLASTIYETKPAIQKKIIRL